MTLVLQAIWLVRYPTNDIVNLPGRWIMKQWPAGVNSRFADWTANNILRMQDITTANDTKKATKLEMKVFRDEQCFNTQFAHMSSVFFSWSPSFADASLLEQLSFHSSISMSHPSQLNFHWPKLLHSRKFECHYPSLKWLWFPTLQQQACACHDFRRKLHKLFFQFLFQVNFKTLITLTAILSGQL